VDPRQPAVLRLSLDQQADFLPGLDDPHPYISVGGNATGVVQGNLCKVLEIKADAETVTQDILLEPVK
jgi:hypothetical protein